MSMRLKTRHQHGWEQTGMASVINTVRTSRPQTSKFQLQKNDKICMLHYAKPLWRSKDSGGICEKIGLRDEGGLRVSPFIMNTLEAVCSLNSWASVFMKVLYLPRLALWELVDSRFVRSAEWSATIYFESSWRLSVLGDVPTSLNRASKSGIHGLSRIILRTFHFFHKLRLNSDWAALHLLQQVNPL